MNIFFLHLQKSGGLSLRASLDEIEGFNTYDLEDIFTKYDQIDPNANNIFYGHAGYSLIELLPQNTKVFTILRDPVDRFISHWKHIVREKQTLPIGKYINCDSHDILASNEYKNFSNLQIRMLAQDIDYKPLLEKCMSVKTSERSQLFAKLWQTQYGHDWVQHLPPVNEEHLTLALKRISMMDFTVLPAFKIGVPRILESFGVDTFTYYRTNEAPVRQPHCFNTPEAKQAVFDTHNLEVDLYKYASKVCADEI